MKCHNSRFNIILFHKETANQEVQVLKGSHAIFFDLTATCLSGRDSEGFVPCILAMRED